MTQTELDRQIDEIKEQLERELEESRKRREHPKMIKKTFKCPFCGKVSQLDCDFVPQAMFAGRIPDLINDREGVYINLPDRCPSCKAITLLDVPVDKEVMDNITAKLIPDFTVGEDEQTNMVLKVAPWIALHEYYKVVMPDSIMVAACLCQAFNYIRFCTHEEDDCCKELADECFQKQMQYLRRLKRMTDRDSKEYEDLQKLCVVNGILASEYYRRIGDFETSSTIIETIDELWGGECIGQCHHYISMGNAIKDTTPVELYLDQLIDVVPYRTIRFV